MKRSVVFSLGSAVFFAVNSDAAVLSQYTFPTAVPSSETGTTYNSTLTAAGVAASAITDAGTNILIATELGAYATPFLKLKSSNGASTVPTAAAAYASNSYVTFSLTSASGFNLTTLTFDASRGGASTARGFVIQSSIGGFGSSGAVLSQVNSIPTEQGTVPRSTAYSIDLSGAEFQGLTNIVFRIYAFSDGTAASVDFDNITLNGSVIPEPGGLLLRGVAMGASLLRRSRRR